MFCTAPLQSYAACSLPSALRPQLTTTRAQEFYGEHVGEDFFDRLVEFMTSGPIHVLVLSRDNAIKEWLTLMGPSNCFRAREEAPRR
jgi:nucleoside diphosphate kinase